MVKDIETLSEEERARLEAVNLHLYPALPIPGPNPAHPGEQLTTNKAAALAKFLERKLKEANGLASINPDLLELAVNNAKQTVNATSGSTSNPERSIRHVDSFGDTDDEDCTGEEETNELSEVKERKKKKKEKKKSKKQEEVKKFKF